MKRNLPSMIAGVVLVVILGLYMITYQVRSTQVAVLKTFDKATEASVISEPGLKWKLPWPIQKVDWYDNRVQLTGIPGEETSTFDRKTIIVSTSVGWRIGKPFEFSKNFVDMKAAEDRLRSLVRNEQKTILSSYSFGNLVSKNSEELQFDRIEQDLLAKVQAKALEKDGIDVKSIRIDKLSLPASVTEKVFDAMRKERQAQADQYTSEGQSEAERIKKEAESIANTIRSFADQKAAEIVAEGTAAAVAANKTFSKDEQLAIFLLKLNRLGELLKERSTIILDAEQAPFDLIPEKAPVRTSAGANLTTQPAVGSIQISTGSPEMVEPR
jgi:modulator of FtsH protease HflC